MADVYAGVRILHTPIHCDREYTYFIPRELIADVMPGVFVTVPFGGGNRKKTAIVTSLLSVTNVQNCKPITSVTSCGIRFTDELLSLCAFLCEYTLCTYGEAVHTVIPSAALSRVCEYYCIPESSLSDGSEADDTAADEAAARLSSKAMYLYSFIKAHGRVSVARLRSEFGDAQETAELTAALLKMGLVTRIHDVKESTNRAFVREIKLAVPESEAISLISGDARLRSARSREILDYLLGHGGISDEDELKTALGAVTVQIKTLAKLGYVGINERTVWRNPFAIKSEYTPVRLNEQQSRAYDTLCGLYRSGTAKAALLYGVTGSGKTSVIRAMIDAVTADGRSVIILVPEISLTPQTVNIFCSNYGERVAVIHSSLSEGERIDAWRRIDSGEADIVIGTRSAVFAPVKRLGMIVIDEEQEHTYKSDTQPKYKAHDVARFRCAANGALMLLSSATPSLQSFYKAEAGNYTLVSLTERYGGAVLPRVIVADMRRERAAGATSPIGSILRGELAETISRGEAAILFLNRRGYNNFLSCRSCGEAVYCPHCSVSLTYHAYRRVGESKTREEYRVEHSSAGRLECHYCGYSMPAPEKCPSCGSENMYYMGWGIQLVEQELHDFLPQARILRMDADTTKTKSAYDDILGAFGRHEADILLGTQMVTKGHDFPDVTLVGVLLAETSLYIDDYRAGERTFSLITQVIGRAGRASMPGRAVIQTYTPENESLSYAFAQDYRGFYDSEIKFRRAYSYPPFCDLAQLVMTSEDEAELAASILRLTEYIRKISAEKYSDVPIVMFGPFEAPVYRVNERCRMRIIIKCKLTSRTRAMFSDIIRVFGAKLGRRVTLSVDFNPNSV